MRLFHLNRPDRGVAPWLLHLAAMAAVLLALATPAQALTFPALTGRIVDEAGMLSPATKSSLESTLSALEAKSSDQLVVVTLRSLQDTDIADYGYQLGRHWGIGQGKLNNGVLLIVAPKERRVRIEVGYGLEGTLTDALSSVIIQRAVLPQFRNGDMEAGVVAGVNAIRDVLTGDGAEWQQRARDGARPADDMSTAGDIYLLIFLAFFAFIVISGFMNRGPPGRRQAGSRMSRTGPIFIPTSGGFGGGFGGGSFGGGGGGFSGGGGSFGGGGASGSW